MKGKMMRKLKVDLTKYHRWFIRYCILSLVYDGDMLFQGNMMDSIYPDNLIDIDESVGITKEEIFV